MNEKRSARKRQTDAPRRSICTVICPCVLIPVFLLIFTGCIAAPGARDGANAFAPSSSGPELPEGYETDVRGAGRVLIQAAFAGSSSEVKSVLESENRKDLADEYITASLLLACVRGNTDTVRVMLEEGADVNAATVRGGTALMWAAGSRENPADTVRVLLEAGAAVNAQAENGYTALMDAAAKGNIEITRSLIAAGAEVDVKNDEGTTALMIAASLGHPEGVQVLLQSNADLTAVDRDGKTALDRAREADHAEVMDLLIRAGAPE